LVHIVEALDGLADYERCVSGLAECTDDAPCAMHEVWKDLRSRIMDYLEKTTIADLVRALEEKRKALDKARRPVTVGVAQRT
jgi:DNA-binding IscR family transcriptional regulator